MVGGEKIVAGHKIGCFVFRCAIAIAIVASLGVQMANVSAAQIHIRGSDSYSGGHWGNLLEPNLPGGFRNPSTTSDHKLRGSWSQYNLFSNGRIEQHFGSGGWTYNENLDHDHACKLLFKNTDGAGGDSSCIWGGFLGSFSGTPGGDTNKVIDLPDGNGNSNIGGLPPSINSLTYDSVNKYSSSITISGGGLPNRRIFVYVTGASSKVTISSDITCSGSYNNVGQVPMFIVYNLNGDIEFAPGVKEVCGIYVAGGRILTGSGANQLIIHGAVISKADPNLGRTFGAGGGELRTEIALSQTGQAVAPSEIFDYTPNIFLTPYYIRSGMDGDFTGQHWTTDSIRDLPVRL